MSWQRRYFKDSDKVWVKIDDEGNPVVEDGRVPMRYSDDEDAKIYRASPQNISSKPADQLEPGGMVPDDSAFENPEVPKAKGRLRASRTVPDELAGITEPDDGVIEIHTDGACSGNPGPCGYGVVLRDGFFYREISQYIGRGTNNIAELKAIKVALQAIKDKSRPVRIYSDSRYAIGVLTKGWDVNANQQLVRSIKQLLEEFDDVEIRKIKGHAGEPLNERADDLATSAVDEGKS